MTREEILAALATGVGPDGLPVRLTATMTLRKFEGDGTDGKEPVETVTFKLVNGQIVEEG